ncbi:hypothetical protein PQC18_gp50 [Streptomyces phage Pablito]|uniref:Uncharacterized protein n=1 Tax=Streptomyces phage Pablito TaxID=2894593 RepID=A0AAE9C6N8_9CAUD|nr:hypothetical protein PQC18_gp50 [Streptomyces phage Pablito]UFD97988.1 hypothetical protein [Streptomyces phage Pablito]
MPVIAARNFRVMVSDEQTTPGIGELAKDTGRDTVGVVMGHVGSYVQLRPINGGREWDAKPDRVRSLTAREELSARLAVRNAISEGAL